MKRIRIIPTLTLDNEKLVKTIQFKKPNYIGDPINAVKIFNEKEVDEVVLLDITATKQNRPPNYSKIEEIASEAFMPFAYGGGIKNLQQIEKLFKLGIEKIVLNSILNENLELITEAAKIFGSQSIVASVDINKNLFGKQAAYTSSGTKKIKTPLLDFVKQLEEKGVGELFINSIDRDGTFSGYDFTTLSLISNHVAIPIVACGGAKNTNDFLLAVEAGASAVAAASLFVYQGAQKGILINYPSQEKLQQEIFNKL